MMISGPVFVPTLPPAPPWLEAARRYLGLAEAPGAANNPTILRWAARVGGWIASWFARDGDAIPWCALFVNQCLAESGLDGTGSLSAFSFETWGRRLETPALGCVIVFRWLPANGHVGFYAGERADGALLILGGNQRDRVSLAWWKPDHAVAFAWPLAVEIPAQARVIAGDAGELVRVIV